MNQLENLQLSEEDFALINQGLDLIPTSNAMGESIAEAFTSSIFLAHETEEEKRKYEREKLQRRKDRKAERLMQMENIRVLQGKLIQFKRFLREKGLLEEVNEILNKPTNGDKA